MTHYNLFYIIYTTTGMYIMLHKSSTCGEENMDYMVTNEYYINLLSLQAALSF